LTNIAIFSHVFHGYSHDFLTEPTITAKIHS